MLHEAADEAAIGLANVNLAAAADIKVKPGFRRQQTEELKKELVAAVAVGDYEAAAQLKKVIAATESAIEESLSAAEVAATEELKQELAAAVAVEDYERAAELKKAITAIEDKATEVEAIEELKKELAAAVAVGDYERAAELKKAITAAESTLASEPRMALSGVARTAPMGATVVLNSGVVYYVHGMERWADDVDGKLVTATGLIKTVAITLAGIDASSAPGVDVCIIRDIDWRLMSSEPEPDVPPPPAQLGQSPMQSTVLLPAPGAINDDEHDERPRSPGFCRGNIRTSRILGRIGKEAFFSSLTHSSHDGKYDASHGMTMEHGFERLPRAPSARPPAAAARVAS
jgi:protein-arginine kinase activator protein McsA